MWAPRRSVLLPRHGLTCAWKPNTANNAATHKNHEMAWCARVSQTALNVAVTPNELPVLDLCCVWTQWREIWSLFLLHFSPARNPMNSMHSPPSWYKSSFGTSAPRFELGTIVKESILSEHHAVVDCTFGKSPKILLDFSAGCHGPRALKVALLVVGVGQGQGPVEVV